MCGPPCLLSAFHLSANSLSLFACLFLPVCPFIPVSPSVHQPFLSVSISCAIFWVLLRPALLTTKILSPVVRSRDPQETKSSLFGLTG